MIVLIAKNIVQEGKEQAFMELALQMVQQSRREPGCIGYDLVRDKEEKQVFYFIEKYADEAALEQHRATLYFHSIVPQMGELRVKPSEVRICTVVSDC